ncbi:MAG: hypothetical protein K8S94_17665 [Planctomycetia bacterium]|nr:hypothetical protein [Planctomycetia bacterium]
MSAVIAVPLGATVTAPMVAMVPMLAAAAALRTGVRLVVAFFVVVTFCFGIVRQERHHPHPGTDRPLEWARGTAIGSR